MNFQKIKSVLVIAPHADDELIGCGGVINKLSKAGAKVKVMVITNASLSGSEQFSAQQIADIRLEAERAGKFVGISEYIFSELPALELNLEPQYLITEEISRVISLERPELLFIPHPSDLHLDHKTVYYSALVAARPHYINIKAILCYETLSETNWSPRNDNMNFVPNLYIDITNEIDAKLQGLAEFKSQMCDSPHPRSIDMIKSLATVRGADVFKDYAEAFSVERIVF